MMDFANKAVTFSEYLTYWTADTTRNNVLAISFFFVLPILVNILNVRKYGEVEFWVTAFKLLSIMGLILVAFVIATGGAPSAKLGTSEDYRAVDCAENVIGACLSSPGFGCDFFFPSIANFRLECPFQDHSRPGKHGKGCRFLGKLLLSHLWFQWDRNSCDPVCRDGEAAHCVAESGTPKLSSNLPLLYTRCLRTRTYRFDKRPFACPAPIQGSPQELSGRIYHYGRTSWNSRIAASRRRCYDSGGFQHGNSRPLRIGTHTLYSLTILESVTSISGRKGLCSGISEARKARKPRVVSRKLAAVVCGGAVGLPRTARLLQSRNGSQECIPGVFPDLTLVLRIPLDHDLLCRTHSVGDDLSLILLLHNELFYTLSEGMESRVSIATYFGHLGLWLVDFPRFGP